MSYDKIINLVNPIIIDTMTYSTPEQLKVWLERCKKEIEFERNNNNDSSRINKLHAEKYLLESMIN